jgi:hypothetical protein
VADPEDLPPDCLLIRRKRQAMVPTMSMRAAAKAAGLPEATWRQAENGTRARTRDVLARQALAVDASPWELEQVNRPDAAAELRTLLRIKLDETAGVPGELREAAAVDPALLAEIVHGLADIDRADALTKRQKGELREELITGIMRDIGERRAHVRAVLRIASNQDVG